MFFINPFSVWLDWPEMQHLYPYLASFVSNGCSKWLPKYYFLAIWLQTLSGSIQSCQAVTQNGCQTTLACPLGSRPSLVQSRAAKLSKWLPKYYYLATWLQTLSGSVQSCQAATQNGCQNIFLGHLAPNPIWFSPELPSCHSKWLPKYFSLATWLQTQEPRSNPDLIIIQSKWQPSF